MKRLNGMDAMLPYSETPNLHTHALKVAVIDPSDSEFGFEAFRRHVRRRLHLLEPLHYRLVDIPWQLHHPMWQENCLDECGGVPCRGAARAWSFRGRGRQRDFFDRGAVAGAPVNITVWSYVDRLGAAVLTDDQTFGDPHEATDAICAAFNELRATAGVSAQAASTASSAE